MSDRYILVGQTPVPCDDLFEWARWMEDGDRRVFRTSVGDYEVSTVFLGIDHDFSFTGIPVLFETMIFVTRALYLERLPGEDIEAYAARRAEIDEKYDQDLLYSQWRYITWMDAEAGHDRAVQMVEEKTGVKRTPVAMEGHPQL